MYIDSYISLIQYGEKHNLDLYWINRYIQFIIRCSKRYTNVHSLKSDKHHIFPKSWGGCNDETNLINLPVKAHIIAHHILSKTKDLNMVRAFQLMCNRIEFKDFKYGITIRLIEELTLLQRETCCVPMVNLTTGEIFPSKKAAAEAYGVADIEGYRLRIKVAGCYWQAKDKVDQNRIDYELQRIENHKKQLKQRAPERIRRSQYKGRQIICIDTGQVYQDYVELAGMLAVKSPYTVVDVINKMRHTKGRLYTFLDTFKSKEEQFWKDLISTNKRSQTKRNKKVVDLTDEIVFESLKQASEHFQCDPKQISDAIYYKCRFREHYWLYFNEGDDIHTLKQSMIEDVEETKKSSHKGKLRPIYNLITKQYYPSTVSTVEQLGLKDRSYIAAAISKGVKVLNKYYFQYASVVDQIGFEKALE